VYAIIEDSGTQIKVAPCDGVEIDLRPTAANPANGEQTLRFERVLLVGGDDGDARIGAPYVDGAVVEAEVLDEIKGEKIDVLKYKRRKGYRVKKGHRQRYLRVRISDIKG
jgi:large subunit ribosomal protein L21